MRALFLFTFITAQLLAFEGLTLSSKLVKNGESLLVQYEGEGSLKPISIIFPSLDNR